MIRHLLLLNGLAVIGAVVNHALGWGFTSLFWWTDRYEAVAVPDFSQLGSPTYYALRGAEQLITFSLPAFLFVSGFFVAFAAGRGDRKLGWEKVSPRIRMLLIPYLVWSVAIFALRGVEGTTDTSVGYLEQLLFGRAAEPYYYVPLIIQMYVLSLLVVGWIKDYWKPVLVVAAIVQLVAQVARYPVLLGWDVPAAVWIANHTPGWFFPHLVFWFAFGVFAGFHPSTLGRLVTRWKPVLPWAAAALGVMALVEWELILRASGEQWLNPTPTVLDSLYTGAFILTFVAFAAVRLPMRPQLDALGERSFGVYLVHAPVLELLSRMSYHLTPPLLAHVFVFLCVLIVAGVAVPLVLMTTVNRSSVRPYYNYLFG